MRKSVAWDPNALIVLLSQNSWTPMAKNSIRFGLLKGRFLQAYHDVRFAWPQAILFEHLEADVTTRPLSPKSRDNSTAAKLPDPSTDRRQGAAARSHNRNDPFHSTRMEIPFHLNPPIVARLFNPKARNACRRMPIGMPNGHRAHLLICLASANVIGPRNHHGSHIRGLILG